jgi:hypothetical protein
MSLRWEGSGIADLPSVSRTGAGWKEYVFRYFQRYLRANASPKPDASGAWFLGDIEGSAPTNWTKVFSCPENGERNQPL